MLGTKLKKASMSKTVLNAREGVMQLHCSSHWEIFCMHSVAGGLHMQLDVSVPARYISQGTEMYLVFV